MSTEIRYNNSVLASLQVGQTATLNCKGKKMLDDVFIVAPEENTTGGAKKYDVSYDMSFYENIGAAYSIIAQPTEIYEGQTVNFVFGSATSEVDPNVEGVAELSFLTPGYLSSTGDKMLYVLSLSNPTGNVNVAFKQQQNQSGGSN